MRDLLWQLDGVHLAGARGDRLTDVSVTVHAGTTAVIGRSGAGKSSLLHVLAGFETPTHGSVQANLGTGTERLPLFWSPQDGGLWPHLSVLAHLEAVAPSSRHGDEIPESIITGFDLAEVRERMPDQLSQGQRSRLAVARALSSRAEVLVMDEPLAHVETGSLEAYWALIRSLLAPDQSLIFATHDPAVAVGEADHAICIDRGRIVFTGTTGALWHAPPTRELAELLGPTNWLPAEEAAQWLTSPPSRGPCVRPHALEVVPGADGPLRVQSWRRRGGYDTAQLQHRATGAMRYFFCRPATPAPAVGVRVALRLCLLAFACLLPTACGPADGASLPVKEVHHWPMPRDGTRVPQPRSVTRGDPGELIVLDNAGRVLIFDESGALRRQWRMPDNTDGNPEGACLLNDGRIVVADTHYHRLVFFDNTGNVLATLGEEGTGPGQFIFPVKIAVDPTGHFYVAEYGGNDRVQKFTPDGRFLLAFGGFSTAPGHFQRPGGMVWHAGRLYIADVTNNRVQVFEDSGRFVEVLGHRGNDGPAWTLKLPYDVAMGPEGMLYVVTYGTGRLTVVRPDGTFVGRFGVPGRDFGEFLTPWGVAVLPDRRVVIADTGNRRLVEVVQ